MPNQIVFTLSGPDRVGIVEEVTRVMVDVGANVETSRMARLGGEFAIIMMAALPGSADGLAAAFESLESQGYHVSFHEASGARHSVGPVLAEEVRPNAIGLTMAGAARDARRGTVALIAAGCLACALAAAGRLRRGRPVR